MSHIPIPFDISQNKDLLRLAEEVNKTRTPRELKKDNETLAVLVPAKTEAAASPVSSQTGIEEILALAGSWGERDWNEVETELDALRHHSQPTPPFEP